MVQPHNQAKPIFIENNIGIENELSLFNNPSERINLLGNKREREEVNLDQGHERRILSNDDYKEKYNVILSYLKGNEKIKSVKIKDSPMPPITTFIKFEEDYYIAGHENGIITQRRCDNNHLIKCFDNMSNANESKKSIHESTITDILQTRDKNLILTTSTDKTIAIWDINDFKCILSLYDHSGSVNSIIQVRSKEFVTCSDDKSIILWSLENLSVIHKVENAHDNCILKLFMVNDFILSTCKDNFYKLWKIEEDQLKCFQTSNKYSSHITSIALVPNQSLICFGFYDGSLQLLDYRDNFKKIIESKPHNYSIVGLIHIEKDILVSLSNSGIVVFYYIHESKLLELNHLKTSHRNNNFMGFKMLDDNRIITWGKDNMPVIISLK